LNQSLTWFRWIYLSHINQGIDYHYHDIDISNEIQILVLVYNRFDWIWLGFMCTSSQSCQEIALSLCPRSNGQSHVNITSYFILHIAGSFSLNRNQFPKIKFFFELKNILIEVKNKNQIYFESNEKKMICFVTLLSIGLIVGIIDPILE